MEQLYKKILILIWILDEQQQLSKPRRKLLADYSNSVYLSQISLMELAIKKNLNKLPDIIPEISIVANNWISNGFEILPLSNQHIFTYLNLPFIQQHKDPFDRFLISIAKIDDLILMSDDIKFKYYDSRIKII